MADVSALQEKVRARGREIATAAGVLVTEAIKANAAPHNKTGDLMNSIQPPAVSESGSSFTVRVAVESEHASYLDTGADPHEIVGNPRLVFFWPKAGRVVFLPRVQHPGNAPTRFFADPVERWGEFCAQAAAT